MIKKQLFKIGHQAPKPFRINRFNSVEIEGDFAYCASHKFVYNIEEEEKKLYNGEACYYTDKRFYDGRHNYYKNTKLHWTRFKDVSLKACMRMVRNCKNIPIGTIVSFQKSWYYTGKNVDNSFNYKVRKENKLELNYEVSYPGYFENFETCDFAKKLTDALRANGFLVYVRKENPDYLMSMVSNAAAHIGQKIEVEKVPEEIAFAYGHGKRIGFTARDNSLMGYSYARESVLFDWYDEFNKWSRCKEILKTTPIEEILETLMEKRVEEELVHG